MTETGEHRAANSRQDERNSAAFAEASLGSDDQRWLATRFGGRGSVSVRMQLVTDTDTEGHGSRLASSAVRVRIASDEMDLEGHAFTLHFPSVPDADAFKRGVAAGAIAASLVVGGVAGAIAVSSSQAAAPAGQPAAAAPATHLKLAPAEPEQQIHVRWGGRAIAQ
jgi:hypothetical protein